MGVEIVGTKLVGTYACTTAVGAPDSIRRGWGASQTCVCDNTLQFLNCAGVPRLSAQNPTDIPFVRPINRSHAQ